MPGAAFGLALCVYDGLGFHGLYSSARALLYQGVRLRRLFQDDSFNFN